MKNLFILLILVTQYAFSYHTEPFQIYNKKGKKVSVNKFFRNLESSEIILFGELHNNPISHWLQLKVTKYLHHKNTIALGAEMLDANNQVQLNNYLAGHISQATFDSTATLWMNYKTDYKPLVDFAKSNNIDFIATNIPRKYASFVYRNGLEAL